MVWWDWSGLIVLLLIGLGAWLLWDVRPWRASKEESDNYTDTIQAGDLSIRYHRSGSGPYLLLVHGIGANLYCWSWLIPLLNPHFTVIAIDLPGFGQSSKPHNAKYGLDDQVQRLKIILSALGVSQTYVVGNSMGGNIALWLARTFPDLVKGTCVIAPASSPKLVPLPLHKLAFAARPLSLLLTRQTMRKAHQRTLSRRERATAERAEESFRTYGRQPAAIRSFLMATESIRDPRLPSALAEIKSPLLVLWGSLDRLVPRRVIDDLLKALPTAETHVHVGGGHQLQEDEPEWVTEKILTFFLS